MQKRWFQYCWMGMMLLCLLCLLSCNTNTNPEQIDPPQETSAQETEEEKKHAEEKAQWMALPVYSYDMKEDIITAPDGTEYESWAYDVRPLGTLEMIGRFSGDEKNFDPYMGKYHGLYRNTEDEESDYLFWYTDDSYYKKREIVFTDIYVANSIRIEYVAYSDFSAPFFSRESYKYHNNIGREHLYCGDGVTDPAMIQAFADAYTMFPRIEDYKDTPEGLEANINLKEASSDPIGILFCYYENMPYYAGNVKIVYYESVDLYGIWTGLETFPDEEMEDLTIAWGRLLPQEWVEVFGMAD